MMYRKLCLGLFGIFSILISNNPSAYTTPAYTTPSYNGYNPFQHPCAYHFKKDGSFNRSVSYTLQTSDVDVCETTNLTAGWYIYDNYGNVPLYPPSVGQCGSSSPIWFNGTYPTKFGDTSTLTACIVSNTSDCGFSWNVTVMNCCFYNVVYLTPVEECGRFCLDNQANPYLTDLNHPCVNHTIVTSSYNRTFSYYLQPGDVDECESGNTTEGWHRYDNGMNVPTTPPSIGQCGSSSPIWFNGSYPTSTGETKTMKACMVTNTSICEYSWNVTVMHCCSYNIAYLPAVNYCGRYCLDYYFDYTYTTPSYPTSYEHPCINHTVIDASYNRSVGYYLKSNDTEDCDMFNFTAGWYRYSNLGNIPTYPVSVGQCGSSSPIWLNGSYPYYFGQNKTMTACMVTTTSNCQPSWEVTVMNCGYYNIAYLPALDRCGKYCLDDSSSSTPYNYYTNYTTPSSYMNNECYMTSSLPYEYTRSISYNLSSSENGTCESNNVTAGWYSFSTLRNIATQRPEPGQCGSNSPIYLQGSYPTMDGQYTTMTACMVDDAGGCKETWPVLVKRCYGYNIFYLNSTVLCGKYCRDDSSPTTPYNYYTTWSTPPDSDDMCYTNCTTVEDDLTRSLNFRDNSTCESDNVTASCYRLENHQKIPTTRPMPGDCGSDNPIYFQGTYPTMIGETRTMTLCMVGNTTGCIESWSVQVKQCNGYRVTFINQTANCGRYCLESLNETEKSTSYDYTTWSTPSSYMNDECYKVNYIPYEYTRSNNYNLSSSENGTCESNNITEGWYSFSTYQNIPTQRPEPGQCGSNSPIYLQGSYPTHHGNYSTMTACMVDDAGGCKETWNVLVKNCNGYNIFYLNSTVLCGMYCRDDSSPSTPYSYYTTWSTPPDSDDMCYTNCTTVEDDLTRSLNFRDNSTCESDNVTASCYRLENHQKIPTTRPMPGDCGSDNPIYFQGTYPTMIGETRTMTFCMVGNTTGCVESWSVQVKQCNGYRVTFINQTANCGRYCLESLNETEKSTSYDYTTWSTPSSYMNDECYKVNYIPYEYTRSNNYNLSSSENGTCESNNITEGWYSFSSGLNIPTQRPEPGQCGSNSPIYLQGSYPTQHGNYSTMTACMVDEFGGCKETWPVVVKHCTVYGYEYNIFYLNSTVHCGKYCRDDSSQSTTDYSVSTTSSSFPYSSYCYNYGFFYYESTRKVTYQKQPWDYDYCDYYWGWYRIFDNYHIPTTPVESGQCGSSSPIYLQGSYPTAFGESTTLDACVVGNDTECKETFNVTAINCGGYIVLFLKTPSTCGRYCLNDTTAYYSSTSDYWSDNSSSTTSSPYDEECYNHYTEIDVYTRGNSYNLSPGDNGTCESNNITAGWYRYINDKLIPSTRPSPGQCGTLNPIYLQGTYPTMVGEYRTLTACMVEGPTGCKETWPVVVKQCNGYKIAYLNATQYCGRYCLDDSTSDSSMMYSQSMMGTNSIDQSMWASTSTDMYGSQTTPSSGSPGLSTTMETTMFTSMQQIASTSDWSTSSTMQATASSSEWSASTGMQPSTSSSDWSTSTSMQATASTSDWSTSTNMPPSSSTSDWSTSTSMQATTSTSDWSTSTTMPPSSSTSDWSTSATMQPSSSTSDWSTSTPIQATTSSSQWSESSTTQTTESTSQWSASTTIHPLSTTAQWSASTTVQPSASSSNDEECNTMYIFGNETRILNYNLSSEDNGTCESNNLLAETWYRYRNYQNIPTERPEPGQCGSRNPIYVQGTYPTMPGQYATLTACMVNNAGGCLETWSVVVKHCNGYNVAYLNNTVNCGRYCMEETPESSTLSTTMETTDSDWSTSSTMQATASSSEWSASRGMQQSTSSSDWSTSTSMQATALTSDWSTSTTMQPSSSTSDWSTSATMQPSSSTSDWSTSTPIQATTSSSEWSESSTTQTTESTSQWSASTTIHPLSTTAQWSASTTVQPSASSSNDEECNTMYIFGNETRILNYNLSSEDNGTCESNNLLAETWYRYRNYQNIPTERPEPGQCGSRNPIYVQGTYPTMPGQYATLTACMVNNVGGCLETWSIVVKHCNGYNVAYLNNTVNCGRYCMEETPESSTLSTTMETTDSDWSTLSTMQTTASSSEWSASTGMQQSTSSSDWSTSTSMQATALTSDWSTSTTMQPSSSTSDWSTSATMQPSSSTSDWSTSTPIQATTSSSEWSESSTTQTTESTSQWSASTTIHPLSTTAQWSASRTVQPSASSSNDEECNTMYIFGNETRILNYNLSSEDNGTCESNNLLAETWYRYRNYQNIPTERPEPGQCGSRNPIYVQGTYPTVPGQYATLTACMVNNVGGCLETWSIVVKHCNGYNVAYLNNTVNCGRYCMEETPESSTLSTTMETTMFTASSTDSISPTTSSGEMMSTSMTESTTASNIILRQSLLVYSPSPEVPTETPGPDRQLMFKCSHYTWNNAALNSLRYDVMWEISNTNVKITKSDLAWSEIETTGRLRSTEWTAQGIGMGFNVKCGIKLHGSTDDYVMSRSEYFAGIRVSPTSVTISSGETARFYAWSSVPIACRNDQTDCKLKVSMLQFTEEMTSGSLGACQQSALPPVEPSLCGLEFNGRNRWDWQTMEVKLPASNEQEQSFQAKIRLQVSSASTDPMWEGYSLSELTIHTVTTNVTDDYWWWYGYCFTGTDPWYSTLDWRWYFNDDQGVFVLYKVPEKQLEIQTIQRRYKSWHSWTEHCAIAIRYAGEVWMIYGCTNPTKWKVRRYNCDPNNELLTVYNRWGGYEVTLPTGTTVYIWISRDRRLNYFIVASKADRGKTSGLCGTYNGDYSDDFKGPDGTIYNSATPFYRSWKVDEANSLFKKQPRQTVTTQSVLYCTCSDSTVNADSPSVDCSYQETRPVCPRLNWDKKACTTRSKRSTETGGDDDEIDATVTYEEGAELSTEWKNGWTLENATETCNTYLNDSGLFEACSSIPNVNVTESVSLCILDIQVSGTVENMPDSFENLMAQCETQVRTNSSLWDTNSTTGGLAELIISNVCPSQCTYNNSKNGNCVNSTCECFVGYVGDDCRINLNLPPGVVTTVSEDSACDSSTTGSCTYASVFGDGFYNSVDLKCLVEKAELINNELVRNGTSITTTAEFINMLEVRCPLTNSRRRKRSTSSSTSSDVYLVSVTNNGVNYSDPVTFVTYDSSCTTCTTTNNVVVCQLRTDICVINGVCYASTHSQCSTDDSSSNSKIWIIGGVVSGLLFIIIVILLVKWFKPKWPIACGSNPNDKSRIREAYGPDDSDSRPGSADSFTRVDV